MLEWLAKTPLTEKVAHRDSEINIPVAGAVFIVVCSRILRQMLPMTPLKWRRLRFRQTV